MGMPPFAFRADVLFADGAFRVRRGLSCRFAAFVDAATSARLHVGARLRGFVAHVVRFRE
jgi:hypothetical protein